MGVKLSVHRRLMAASIINNNEYIKNKGNDEYGVEMIMMLIFAAIPAASC